MKLETIYKHRAARKTGRIMKYTFLVFAFFCLFMFVISFTTGPFWIYYWLGTTNSGITEKPESIIILGGGGMPSESGLIRCYYAAELASAFPEASIIIALPGDREDTGSSVTKMQKELELRNIKETRIRIESSGTNTRAQALNIKKEYPWFTNEYVVIVTSPEHMYRSVLTFRKAGFEKIGGFPAFEQAIEADILFDDGLLGGRKYIPEVGKSVQLRYQFWNHLKYEIMILREFFAIGYYKLKGWI